jgi:hypothetical protein
MSGTNIDHIVSIIVFLASMLIFIGLFSQTVETAVSYQQHSSSATKAGDLLDNLLLNPGNPSNWSQTDWNQQAKIPTELGLQDPEFTQYQLSPFSLMRLYSTAGTTVNYQGQTYVNSTIRSGSSLLVPSNQTIDSSLAAKMMGINGTYGFSLSVSPTIEVTVSEVTFSPLNVSIIVSGQGFPLANAAISYCLITATGSNPPAYPSLTLNYGTALADAAGKAYLDLSSYVTSQNSYALLATASLSGISGIGYFNHPLPPSASVVPLISSFENRTVLLAHSYSIGSMGYSGDLSYRAIFLRATDMMQGTLNNSDVTETGVLKITPSPGHVYDTVNIVPNETGILAIAYSKSGTETGVILMPWGLSSLGFSVTSGGQYRNQNWVSTDMRQVLVDGVAYQAKLAIWNNPGNGVTG